jgi:hypothetical protein
LMKGEDLPLEKRSQSTETDFKRVRPPWGLWVRRYDKRKESNGTFLKSFPFCSLLLSIALLLVWAPRIRIKYHDIIFWDGLLLPLSPNVFDTLQLEKPQISAWGHPFFRNLFLFSPH